MPISYNDIKNDRQWRASTGLSKSQFFILAPLFEKSYLSIFGISMKERQSNSTNISTFQTYEDLLFFTLYSLKCGLTYDVLGLSFSIEGSHAKQLQTFGIRILKATLGTLDVIPKTIYQSIEEFKEDWKDEEGIIVDATEQRIQRPENQEFQKLDYSGKKKVTP